MAHFGEWVHKHRTQLGFTTRDLANKSQVTSATISRIENGKSRPTLISAIGIVKALGFTKETFLKEFLEIEEVVTVAETKGVLGDREFLTNDDMRQLLWEWGGGRKESIYDWIYETLSLINRQFYDLPRPRYSSSSKSHDEYVPIPEDIGRQLVSDAKMSVFLEQKVVYPRTMSVSIITETYQQGGVLVPDDLIVYAAYLHSHGLGEVNIGAVERILLDDILLSDINVDFINMYWQAYQFDDFLQAIFREMLQQQMTIKSDKSQTVANIAIRLWRWCQLLQVQYPDRSVLHEAQLLFRLFFA